MPPRGDVYKRQQQRYEALTERCPDVLQLVPLRELASYLGVRPETLSRIRRRVR